MYSANSSFILAFAICHFAESEDNVLRGGHKGLCNILSAM
jgi:hypothetical protein